MRLSPPSAPKNTPALVCFTGETEIRWLRFLKPGFRHCFALLDKGDHWILYNPLSNRTIIELLPQQPAIALRQRLETAGYTVLETRCQVSVPLRMAPLFPYSCVEAVKRLLGLHVWRVRTPWALYCLLSGHEQVTFPT